MAQVNSAHAFEALKQALRQLPGVGPRNAQRMAFHLLQRNRDGARRISQAIDKALTTVGHCQICNNFSDRETCSICASGQRNSQLLCVVETPADLNSIESTGVYKGIYFVLMGNLSPLDGIGPEKIHLAHLLEVIEKKEIAELVLATNLTSEGEATADYIGSLLADRPSLRITRLARGVPIGSELEYMDAKTLAQAYADRHAY